MHTHAKYIIYIQTYTCMAFNVESPPFSHKIELLVRLKL